MSHPFHALRRLLETALRATLGLACTFTFVAAQANADPTKGEVFLPAAPGWRATLVHQSDAGIWYLAPGKVLPQYGCPEILGCDDKGRLTLLSCYSGKWTPYSGVPDGQWLALARPADVDPRLPGQEIYVGGKAGNVFQAQVRVRGPGAVDMTWTEIAHFPGEEIHTIVAADLRPRSAGDELLVFTFSGAVHELVPNASGVPGFTSRKLEDVGGRVRDAVLLPATGDLEPRLATVARSGELALVGFSHEKFEHTTIAREPMGLGRVTRRSDPTGTGEVLYVTRDDGVVLRFEERSRGAWQREVIYAGPQGPRGIVAGRFHSERGREAVAVFGYSKQVQLVSRMPGQVWTVETIYTDADQGHWLSSFEVDGRNGTDEILASGFGGRIVLLSREPGYGLAGVAVDPDVTLAASRPTTQSSPTK